MLKEEQFNNILNNVTDGVYFVDNNRTITFWNKAAERITGFKSSEILNSYCHKNILNHVNINGTNLCDNECPLHETISDGSEREAFVFLQHKDGHRISTMIHTFPVYEEGKIIGAIEIFSDESLQVDNNNNVSELRKLVYTDQLTQLPNRRYIDTIIHSKLNEYKELGVPFSIAFMDVDNFKNLNDRYGHVVGDDVLKMISKIFNEVTRSTDTIGRYGGEEFIGVFINIEKEKLNEILERIRLLIENSSLRQNIENLSVTISIGATSVISGDTCESILKRADQMLYESKRNGRNRVSIK